MIDTSIRLAFFVMMTSIGSCAVVIPVDDNTNNSFFSDQNFPEQDITQGSEFGFDDELRPTDYLITQSLELLGSDSNLQQRVFLFTTNSSQIRPQAFATLDAHVQNMTHALLSNPNLVVIVEGHTDDRGSKGYNIALAERRAAAVSTYLVHRGVPKTAVRVVSYGEEVPAVKGNDETAWMQNRRVELKY